MWPTEQVPLFEQTAKELGASVTILAQRGEPSPKPYGGYTVSPGYTFAEIVFPGEDGTPFWNRVAELKALG